MSLESRLRILNERVVPGHLFFAPEWIVLGVNNHCNLRCQMCDVGTGNDETNFGDNLVGAMARTMPWVLFEHIVDEMKRFTPHAKLGFAFTEPLAWPHIAKAVKHANDRGVHTSITTNGLLLPRLAESLAEAGCKELFVSIDGPEAVHNETRRKSDSYQRAIAGITKIRQLKNAPKVSVVATVTEWNVGRLAEHVAQLAELDLAHVVVTHTNFVTEQMAARHTAVHPSFVSTRSNDFMLDIARIDLDILAEDLAAIRRLKTAFPVIIQPDITEKSALGHYYEQHSSFVGTHCTDVFRILMIDSDGEAIPAHGRCFRFPVGNINRKPLGKLLNSPALAALRKELMQSGGLMPGCAG